MDNSNFVLANYDQFGTPTSGPTPIYDGTPLSNVWVDNGTTATMDSQSSNSSGTERWQYDAAGDQPTFTISSSGTVSASYYDQVSDTLQATTAAGGTLMDVGNFITAQYYAFGNFQQQATYDGRAPIAWIDYSSTPTVSFSATSAGTGASERLAVRRRW